jgi:hypothetical protein
VSAERHRCERCSTFFSFHECERSACGRLFAHAPYFASGDKEWLPKNLWREWCSQACLDADAEAAWNRWQERLAEGL